MTPEQYEEWRRLVRACEGNYQNSINVGSARMRAVITAVDAIVQESIKKRKAAVQADLLSATENTL